MLLAREVSVSYGSVAAVRGASLALESGLITALVGPNAAGKTSLLSALAGLVPAGGEISLGDRRIDELPAEARAAAGLAFVPDGRRLFGRLTVEQNLLVGAAVVGPRGGRLSPAALWGGREARAAVGRVLERFPLLRDRSRQRADTLSGGEGQLLMIARALVASPRVLLVDEPFQGLSDEASSLVLGALADAAREGAAVAVATPQPLAGARQIDMRHGSLAEAAA